MHVFLIEILMKTQKHLNDLIHNVKLLNNDERRSYGSNFPSTSTASSSHSKRNPRIISNHHKRFSLNENSIDADNIDVSFAFPHDFDKNLSRYSDDIWRKTVSSDCDQSIPVWEKQPEPMTNVWGASSNFYEPPRNTHFFDNDIFSSGGNFFFPTSGASTSNGRRLTTADPKPSSRRKQYGNRVPSTNTSSTTLDSDDEFQTIKKRLSLSSLRTSLCRQKEKALENLNNENQGGASSSSNGASSAISGSNDDFLQVFIISLFIFLSFQF